MKQNKVNVSQEVAMIEMARYFMDDEEQEITELTTNDFFSKCSETIKLEKDGYYTYYGCKKRLIVQEAGLLSVQYNKETREWVPERL